MSVRTFRLNRAATKTGYTAERFCAALREQLEELIRQHDLTLAVPMESRVKSLTSILEKADRHGLQLDGVQDFDDLIGVRLILGPHREPRTTAR